MKPVPFLFLPLFVLVQTGFGQGKPVSKSAVATATTLFQQFETPPNSAMPRVWWHWMNGNITKEGIRKDLLWMHRSNIGGFQHFDAAFATPQIVDKRLIYMTPDWKEAFRHATQLADSLKLEMAIAGSPGWSESGGPWVEPRDGMKKLVWKSVVVKGGQPFTGTLPGPPATTGAFQNLPLGQGTETLSGNTRPIPQYYQDVALIAYRLPASHRSVRDIAPRISSSAGTFTLEQLTDGDLATTSLLPTDSANGYGWIQYAFSSPQTIKAITVVGGGTKGAGGLFGNKDDDRSLEASDDGVNFRRITIIPVGDVLQQTIRIPTTTAKYFRLTVKNPRPALDLGAMFGTGGQAPPQPKGTDMAELILYPYSVIDRYEEKAGFGPFSQTHPLTKAEAADAINPADVIDLTGKMNNDGTLNWNPPAGNWTIIRFGYSLTGKQNHPAPPEATGLEVDKLDAAAVTTYFETYLAQYNNATGGLMGARGLQYVVTDSWEAGQQNWSRGMVQEFQKRRGYSLLPWMPVLTGEIVKSADESERFLWDFRQTIAELIAENHYDQLTKVLTRYGMKRYSESHESGRTFIADGMDVKRTAAIPMSAMWVPGLINGGDLTQHQADIVESASVAHIYGQNLVGAESLTALGIMGKAWSYSPENLKPTADLELASGLNRFIIHTSPHQPVDDKVPGIGLGPFGQWFDRLDTWSELAKVWANYLSRSSHLLQQGKFVADVVYYYGEDNNITNLFAKKLPSVPIGYSYDFINPHALLNLLSVNDKKLVTPSGMSYQVLVLDSNARSMSLPVLRKLTQLVKAGATILGMQPERTPSLADDPAEFQRLVTEVWGSPKTVKAVGAGKVYTGMTIQEVLADLTIQPDFEYAKFQDKTKLLYVHRKLSDGDIYWVNNRNDKAERVEATFRVRGKVPQIWHPETGEAEPASYTITGGRTIVSLALTPNDAVFVVFQPNQGPAPNKTVVTLPAKTEKELVRINGPWKVEFQANRGAPSTATFDSLASFSEHTDTGIKYFAGTATYTKTINLPASAPGKGTQIWLDLGEVKNLAEVKINGKPVGIVWKQPFRVEVTRDLKVGENKVDINVTNLWVNRLIGDAQPNVTHKITYTTMPFYQANSRLLPSGLLGPVRLLEEVPVTQTVRAKQ